MDSIAYLVLVFLVLTILVSAVAHYILESESAPTNNACVGRSAEENEE